MQRRQRPAQFQRAPGAHASLVVWQHDRLERSLPELVRIVGDPEAADIGFESTAKRTETSPAAERLAFHLVTASAELERRVVIERTVVG